jgi:hypothetical protein
MGGRIVGFYLLFTPLWAHSLPRVIKKISAYVAVCTYTVQYVYYSILLLNCSFFITATKEWNTCLS